MRNRTVAAVMALALGAGAPSVQAFTLTYGSSTLSGDDTTGLVKGWTVGGTDHLWEGGWYYRISIGSEQRVPVDSVSASGNSATLGGVASVSSSGGSMDVLGFARQILLDAGSGADSSWTELLTVTNLTGDLVHVSLFYYVDLDLAGSAGGDEGSGNGSDDFFQWDGPVSVHAGAGSPDRWEAEFRPVTVGKLTDSDMDDLAYPAATPLSIGPGDVTYAFQWNFTLDGGQSVGVAVGQDLSLGTVPEPPAWSLLLAGLGAVAAGRRRVRRG